MCLAPSWTLPGTRYRQASAVGSSFNRGRCRRRPRSARRIRMQHRCSSDLVRRSRGHASARPDAPCYTPVGRRKLLVDATAHPRRARSRFSLVCGAVKGVVGEWGLGLQFPPRRQFCVSAKCSWPSISSRRSSFHRADGVSTESVGP
jgi:hypothetical protein